MIKSHSSGIGDILRSSAAWRALRNRFPDAKLFLLLLTREPGYPSEELVGRHHLLSGFFTADKRTRNLQDWYKLLVRTGKVVDEVRPDLVIDFEPAGLRTSLLSLWIRIRYGILALGIGEVPLRGLFYSARSSSARNFARKRGLAFPLEYTYRDFVVLSSLGIERNGIPIELEETEEAKRFKAGYRLRCGIPSDAAILGMNIGCGTPDACHKRPDLDLLSRLVGCLQEKHGYRVLLTGAAFEKSINLEFRALHCRRSPTRVIDLSGETSIVELPGLIRDCTLFLSTDSGPYHMAVALGVPTLALFTVSSRVHVHSQPLVRCGELKTPEDIPALIRAAEELVSERRTSLRSIH